MPKGAVALCFAEQNQGAGGYALQSGALHRFAYKSEICKQNQQGFALLTFGVQSFASLHTKGYTFGVQ